MQLKHGTILVPLDLVCVCHVCNHTWIECIKVLHRLLPQGIKLWNGQTCWRYNDVLQGVITQQWNTHLAIPMLCVLIVEHPASSTQVMWKHPMATSKINRFIHVCFCIKDCSQTLVGGTDAKKGALKSFDPPRVGPWKNDHKFSWENWVYVQGHNTG